LSSQTLSRNVRRATITEVARLAGVSVGTASLALNGSSRVAEATVLRVREAAVALAYVPDHAASSLRRRSTESIALVVPDVANPVYVAMAKAVQQVAKERGYHLSLVSTDNVVEEETHAVQGLARRQVDGLILCSLRVTESLVQALEGAGAPVCVIGRLPGGAAVDNVRVDSETGASLAVRHLAGGGHQTIAFVKGTAGTAPSAPRLAGYRRALQEIGLESDPSLEAAGDFTLEGGRAAALELLERRPDLDAVFCSNDLMAIGVMKVLHERRKRVPEEVAVIGMDDIPECTYCTPTLSSVSLSVGQRGRLAAEMLLDRLSGLADLPAQVVTVAPYVVARESTRPAGAHA
jgi:LacI family transcriptional regulator